MAINYPGPYEVEYEYIVSGLTHKLRVNCIAQGTPTPGTPLASINFLCKDGNYVAANTCVTNLWSWLRGMFNTSVTAPSATLWYYPTPGSFAKTFISALATALPNGAAATATNLSHQTTLSFRSGNGGIMKITLLDDIGAGVLRQVLVPNATGTTQQKIAAYVLSSGGWMIARDDSFPIATTFIVEGQNEAVFNERNR